MAAPLSVSSSSSSCISPAQPFDFLLIVDFEATCVDSNRTSQRLHPQEIIEFPMVLLETQSGKIIAEFQRYIIPVVHPTLSPFCTELTGITQDMVSAKNGAVSFQQAWKDVQLFLDKHQLLDNSNKKFRAICCGNWDFSVMLPQQLQTTFGSKAHVPGYFSKWINVKQAFESFYQPRRRVKGMMDLLAYLNIKPQGRHHSGIDDSRNIAAICQRMLHDGCVFADDVIQPKVAFFSNQSDHKRITSLSTGPSVLQMALQKAMEKKASLMNRSKQF